MRGASQRGGRPKKAPAPGERVAIGLRVSPHIKEALDGAMRQTGRTQSQEAELRLEMTFRAQELLEQVLVLAYGHELAGVILLLARSMSIAGRRGALDATGSFDAIGDWLLNPYAFDQAAQAANVIIEGIRPKGDPRFPGPIGGLVHDALGADIAFGVLDAVKDPDGVNAGLPEEEINRDRETFGRSTNTLIGKRLVNQIKVPDLRELHATIRKQEVDDAR
jgi:hypothetical protein